MDNYEMMATQPSKSKLERYTSSNGYLNIKDNGMFLYYQLKNKPFFKRFTKEAILKYLVYAQPKYYKAGEIVFIDGQVGIITSGSVKIQCHHINGMLNPITIGKYGVG